MELLPGPEPRGLSFPPQSLCNDFCLWEWEESECKLLPSGFTHLSAGRCLRIDKVMKIREVNSEVVNSFNCVLWHPCHTVPVEQWSGCWYMRIKNLAAVVQGFMPCFLFLTSPKAALTKKVNRRCKTGITQLLLLSVSLLKPIFISSWGWNLGFLIRCRLRDGHRSLLVDTGGLACIPSAKELEGQQGNLMYLGRINHYQSHQSN